MTPELWAGGGVAITVLLIVLNQVIKIRSETGGLLTTAATNITRFDRHDEVLASLQEEAHRMDRQMSENQRLATLELEATRHLLRNEFTTVLGEATLRQADINTDVEQRLRDLDALPKNRRR